jgi:hypothetical protein
LALAAAAAGGPNGGVAPTRQRRAWTRRAAARAGKSGRLTGDKLAPGGENRPRDRVSSFHGAKQRPLVS